MKKLLVVCLSLLVATSLVACDKKAPVTDTENKETSTLTKGRIYNGFALATSLTPQFDGYGNWHSDMILPYGEGSSSNGARFNNAENDALLEEMMLSNPVTGKDNYQKAYLEWVKLMNEELPVIPLYANDYHDLYNAKLEGFETSPLWQWPEAIVSSTGLDTFVVGNTSFNGEFYEGWGNSAYDNNVRKLVFGGTGLMTVTNTGDIDKNFFVEEYSTSEDLKTWNFKIKEGIKFSDGVELTANDVAFTYYFFADPSFTKSGGSQVYVPINIAGQEEYTASCEAGACDTAAFTGVKVVNDYEIEFTVKDAVFTTATSDFSKYILPKHYNSTDGVINVEDVKSKLISKPIGAGPYKITEYVEGQFVRLAINEHFTGDVHGDVPTVENVIVKVVPDETDIDMLISGEIDLLPGVVQEDKINAAKDDSKLTFNNYLRHGYGSLTFHTDEGVTRHKAIRQAIGYALDRETFVGLFLGSYGSVTQGPYSTNFWMIDDAWVEENLINYSYQPEKVSEILEADGWVKGSDGVYAKDGERASINVACGSAEWTDPLNIITANSIAETGIEFKFNSIDFAVLLDHYYGVYKG